jgi:hypothetical protein
MKASQLQRGCWYFYAEKNRSSPIAVQYMGPCARDGSFDLGLRFRSKAGRSITLFSSDVSRRISEFFASASGVSSSPGSAVSF